MGGLIDRTKIVVTVAGLLAEDPQGPRNCDERHRGPLPDEVAVDLECEWAFGP